MTTVGDPLVGRLLDGRYEITQRLARGGMATVYRAVDTRLTRTVAVKVMHIGLGDDAEFARKFDREARAAAKLSHPNVVSVFDQGQDLGGPNSRPYIVMEYVEGQTLRDVLNREAPMPAARALEIIEPVLAALAAAHGAGLVHRDVKPENVLISDRGRIKVADFGLAKAVSSQTSTATQGLLIGTVSYLPPELVVSGMADARSDVYSTGVGGMTQSNDRPHLVRHRTTNTFTIDLVAASLSPYTSGGLSWCAQPGCTYYAFENADQDLATHRISSCVTERTGAQAYTDAAPSGARVGRNYPDINGNCLGSTIQPLSTSISGIKANIGALAVSGPTPGQTRIAWGWYMVSPNFGSLWPSSAGAAYNTAETLKAVIIMTDGEFNAPYCDGVIARGYNASSAASNNCDPNNGDPYAQSRALCDAMKAQGIMVYTVGFQINAGGASESLLAYCATTSSGFYNAGSGAELSEAFNAIGRDITQLRISR